MVLLLYVSMVGSCRERWDDSILVLRMISPTQGSRTRPGVVEDDSDGVLLRCQFWFAEGR